MQIKLEKFLFFRVFSACIQGSCNSMKNKKNRIINKENTWDFP